MSDWTGWGSTPSDDELWARATSPDEPPPVPGAERPPPSPAPTQPLAASPPPPPSPPPAPPPAPAPAPQPPPYGTARPAPSAYHQPGWVGHAPVLPDHPQAQTALVLGIVSLAGGLFCAVPFLLGPFAWWLGAKTLREIDAAGGAVGGREQARTGMITGLVATVLLVLGAVAFVGLWGIVGWSAVQMANG